MLNVLAAGHMSHADADFLGWAVVVVIAACALCVLLRLLRIIG